MRFSVLLFILYSGCLFSQAPAKVTLLSVNEGLSQGMAFDILQSRDGFLWIATKDGLNRYDGYRFTVFTHDPFDPFSITSNEVWKIFEDSRGWLWLACPGGLDVFLPQTGHFFHLLPGLQGYNGDSVSFTETPDGTIWMTVAGKFWRIELPEGLLAGAAGAGNAFPGLPVTPIELPGTLFSTVFFTGNGTLLAGSSQGVFRVDPADASLKVEALAGLSVDIIGEDKQGRIWLVALSPKLEGLYRQAEYGMWRWNVNEGPPRTIPCLPYGRYRFDHNGFLWAWKYTDLIFRKWSPEKFANGEAPELTWVNHQAFSRNPAYFPTTIAFDQSGNMWLATNGFGVVKISFQSPGFRSYLPLTSQRMIAEGHDGSLYLQSDYKKRYPSSRFREALPTPWAIPISKTERKTVIAFDRQGNGWANKDADSLFLLGMPSRRYPWKAMGLITCKKGKLLSVSEKGLRQFDPATKQSRLIPFDQPQQLSPNFTYSHFLCEGPTGTIWIFAFEGLIEAAPAGDGYRFRFFKNNPADRSSLSHNTVLSVAADPLEPGRYLWAGTKGGGLNRLDRQSGAFKHYKTEQGLPDNVVYGILPNSRGHLWLSTNRGLCRFHVREETARNFTVADGLQDNEFNQSSYLKTTSGHMIFGGVNGLTVFHPDSLQFNERRPLTAITHIRVNNHLTGFRAREGTDSEFPLLEKAGLQTLRLDLTHRQNLVSLEFAALDFSNPAQNQYRYQLLRSGTFGQNEQEAWVELGYKNSVQFANLQPGNYTFKVLGSNNDGAWSERPAVLEFTIHPPWWASWWAYLLYAGVTGLVILLVYRYQLRQRLQAQEALRLRELDEFKNRFFTNITHEFRTPLTVILGEADKLQREGPTPGHSAGLIRRSGENLLRLVNQLLDLAKLESNSLQLHYVQGDVLAYLRYIAESLQSLADSRGVRLQVECPAREIVMDYDPERLLQIVYNLLSNAIKFTPAGGKVELRAEVAPGQLPELGSSHLALMVSDTGVGIPPEELPRIFDRFYQARSSPPRSSQREEEAPELPNVSESRPVANPSLSEGLGEAVAGTGIGLALTKELVTAMGGEINVESKVGKGTVFTVRLPVSNRAERSETTGAGPQAKPESKAQAPDAAPPDAATVLIIEDHPDVVEYLASFLGEKFALHLAYNGREGIEKALETVPDLIVSDVMMPEKDGFEVCEILKTDERTSHIPIVLLTAKVGVENRIAGLRRGADAYLAKPFHEEELLATLANLLEGRRKLQAKYLKTATQPPPVGASGEPHPADPEDAFLQKLHTAVQERLGDSSLTVEDICRAIGMGRSNLYAKLSALTGTSFNLYLRSLRLARAKELLLTTNMNVSEVAYEVGFKDPKYFSRVFTEAYGMPPSELKS
ncbi:MAG: response regulator [Lewinellaceae bacterium]|nr:response regulator [Lewinellaceae bacterium]